MAQLQNISMGALSEDPDKKIDSLVNHINKQNEVISNEDRTKVIKSDSGIETLTFGVLPTGGNGLLVKDSNGVNRALFGEYPGGDIALKLSKPGEDVTTATDDKLIFSSDYNTFKIVQSGTVALNKPASNWLGLVNVTHNLGFAPAVIAFVDFEGALQPIPYTRVIQTGYGADNGKVATIVFPTNITETTLQFICHAPNMTTYTVDYTNSLDWTIKYYLLAETAN